MAKNTTPKNAATPPKGRPTRARNDPGGRRRVFGPVTQWVVLIVVIVVVIVVAIMLLNGGDFNDLNDVSGVPTFASAVTAAGIG